MNDHFETPRIRAKEEKARMLDIFHSTLASLYRLSENIRVKPVIVAELELRDVKRQIFAADLVECSNHAALNERPEALDCLSMNCADNVLATRMIDSSKRIFFAETLIPGPFIGAEQTNFCGNGLANKLCQSGGFNVIDDAGHNITLTPNCADDHGLARSGPASSTTTTALIPMPVLGFAADESFVNFHNAHELAEILIRESGPDAMAHMPRRAIGTETQHPINLKGTNPLLARQHQVNDAEPLTERLVRILEDRAGQVGEAVIGFRGRTFIAQPIPAHRAVFFDLRVAAARASNALGPAMADQIGATGVLIGESRLPLGDGHLVDLLLVLGHIETPSDRSQYDTIN